MTELLLSRKELDLSQIRARLAESEGRDYWRSLDEVAQTEEFQEMLHREFPEQASEFSDGVSRRNFLKLMGASLAFGGLINCTIQPEEKIVPWVRAPENMIPGKPLYYATAIPFGGLGAGILVESHMGRPTKIEGNPEHPASLGGTHSFTQAAILDLYDPDRSEVVKNAGRISTWGNFVQSLEQKLEVLRLKKGDGLRVLTGPVTSPTLGHQLTTFTSQLPEARWHQYEPANRDNARRGALLAFGEPVNTYLEFAKAQVVLSLDSDFCYAPSYVHYARDFAAGRRLREKGNTGMNRLYTVESTPSATGTIADHRMALDTGAIEAFTISVARELGVDVRGGDELGHDRASGWIRPLVRDLKRHRGASVVVAGDHQAPIVHALAHAMNEALGNVGETVHYTKPLEVESVDQTESLSELVEAMSAGKVEALVIVGGNPAYESPADLDFAGAMEHVEFRAQLSGSEDETSALCHWHIPESHFLESWSDIRAFDGTTSIIQPLIKPLYNSKSAHDLIGSMIGQAGRPALDLLVEYWEKQPTLAGANFQANWQRALHDGLIPGTRLEPKGVRLKKPLSVPSTAAVGLDDEELELHIRPDPSVWDGRLANNGWLQETPKPVTKLTWDNAALVSPATAERLGLSNEQLVELSLDKKSVSAPVWIVPGQANDVVTVHLGYGRTEIGRVGRGTGFNAYSLKTTSHAWSGRGLQLIKTFESRRLGCTQDHHSMEGRHLVRHADLEEYEKHPHFAHEGVHEPGEDFTLYSGFDYSKGNQWGMAIDLNACIGCNACSVACQAENNIPIVGKEEVLNGREMSWIRVDRYYTADLDDPEILNQPVPCMQCENAHCELVCPVTATSHSEEGLNDMIYNRCVGTRYCSNNCPYKVRRFNWLQYADRDTPSLKLQRNPDVTVRYRGVMEKCTYCTQRINAARIDSKKSGQPITDGQIQTACQQACPTEAIVFGNINDPSSKVSQSKASPLNYGMLAELNTRPRTTYLARVKNPNPEIGEG